ncbi:12141_t:CDS:2 [Dentiscutata erythropus]|uniref:12141_t:CDS:1 n=1 Tax=Dentiscutata erythropus TaxID=1348616 RepID=A0A9N8VSZ8_9GLOM|nr:12141_t:CDS:2 [Dentiscutata erythropus]
MGRSLNASSKILSNPIPCHTFNPKSFEPLKSKGPRPVSPVTILLTLSLPPEINNNNDFNSMLFSNMVTSQNDILPLSEIPPMSVNPFEELRFYTSQLKVQLGCSFNTLNNLEFKSNNSIIPSLAILLKKEISLQLPNSNNPLPLVYYEAITSSSDASPFPNKTSLNNSIHVTSPFKNQQQFLTNTNLSKIVSPFIAIPNPPVIFLEEDSDESSDSCFEWYVAA